MAKQSISDEMIQGFGNAVDDIRAKFEESVWGRECHRARRCSGMAARARTGAIVWKRSAIRDVEPEREQAQDIDLQR